MTPTQRLLIFFLLPMIAPLVYPPATLSEGLPVILFASLLLFGLGILLVRGRRQALLLSIFIQGLNVIVRLMMLFPHSVDRAGVYDIPYIIASLISIGLSAYLMLRLDRTDVRVQMVA